MVGAGAQDKGSLRIAVVNTDKLLTESKYAQTCRVQINKLRDDGKLTLQTWDRYHMLSTLDQDVLTKLVLKDAVAPNALNKIETKQMDDLKKKHETLFQQFNTLSQQTQAAQSKEDAAQFVTLQKVRSDSAVRIKDKQTVAAKELQDKSDEFNAKLDKDIRDGIQKVAKDKGLNLVFSSAVLLYADTDISNDVLKHMNK